MPILSIILGLPGEDEAGLAATLDFASRAALCGVQLSFHLVNPQPGCGLGDGLMPPPPPPPPPPLETDGLGLSDASDARLLSENSTEFSLRCPVSRSSAGVGAAAAIGSAAPNRPPSSAPATGPARFTCWARRIHVYR